MRLRDQFRAVLRGMWDEVVRLPERVHAWAVRQHSPWDIAGDGSVAWCRICNVEWPCPEYARLTEDE